MQQRRQTGANTNLMTIRSREKGGRKTGNLSATLAEELESGTAFGLPVFGGVPILRECSCYMGIMAVLLKVLSLILVRNLKVESRQETASSGIRGVKFLLNFFEGILGEEEGKRYILI